MNGLARVARYLLARFFLLFALGILACSESTEGEAPPVARANDGAAARAARAQDSLREVFAQRGPAIVEEARALLARDQPDSAEIVIRPFFFTQDAEILAVRNELVAHRDAAGEERRAAEAERERTVLAKLNRTDNPVERVSTYRDPSSPTSASARSALYLYVTQLGGEITTLRFVIQYVGGEWLFVERYTFIVDGREMTLAPGRYALERGSGDGEIWESYDVTPGEQEMAIVRAVADADEAILQYHGERGQRDRTITADEKQALQNVLEAHEILAH